MTDKFEELSSRPVEALSNGRFIVHHIHTPFNKSASIIDIVAEGSLVVSAPTDELLFGQIKQLVQNPNSLLMYNNSLTIIDAMFGNAETAMIFKGVQVSQLMYTKGFVFTPFQPYGNISQTSLFSQPAPYFDAHQMQMNNINTYHQKQNSDNQKPKYK